MCTLNNNSRLYDCEYFHAEVKNKTELAIKHSSYIKTNVKSNREKRELICMALAIFGIALVTTIAGFFAGVAIAGAAQKSLIDQSNLQHDITPK